MFSKVIGYFIHRDRNLRSDRWIFSVVLVTAALSLIASFVLSVEAIELVRNPDAQFSCSINAIVNCATVGRSDFASILGFPNSFIGMMAMPAFIVVAIAVLFGTKFPKFFMFALQVGTLLALVFAYWLFYVSSFVIGALCPWCLLVMTSTTVMFCAITRYNIREDNLYLSKKYAKYAKSFIGKDYDKFALAIVIALVIAIIIIKYGGNGLFD